MRAVIIAMTVAGSAAAATPASLASLPPPAGAHAAPATQASAKALDDAVAAYARGSFTIEQSRHFALTEKLGWQQIVKPLANRIAQAGGKRVPIDWNRPGYDLIELFRLPDGSGLAVAMDYAAPPAHGKMVGYYKIGLKG